MNIRIILFNIEIIKENKMKFNEKKKLIFLCKKNREHVWNMFYS